MVLGELLSKKVGHDGVAVFVGAIESFHFLDVLLDPLFDALLVRQVSQNMSG